MTAKTIMNIARLMEARLDEVCKLKKEAFRRLAEERDAAPFGTDDKELPSYGAWKKLADECMCIIDAQREFFAHDWH